MDFISKIINLLRFPYPRACACRETVISCSSGYNRTHQSFGCQWNATERLIIDPNIVSFCYARPPQLFFNLNGLTQHNECVGASEYCWTCNCNFRWICKWSDHTSPRSRVGWIKPNIFADEKDSAVCWFQFIEQIINRWSLSEMINLGNCYHLRYRGDGEHQVLHLDTCCGACTTSCSRLRDINSKWSHCSAMAMAINHQHVKGEKKKVSSAREYHKSNPFLSLRSSLSVCSFGDDSGLPVPSHWSGLPSIVPFGVCCSDRQIYRSKYTNKLPNHRSSHTNPLSINAFNRFHLQNQCLGTRPCRRCRRQTDNESNLISERPQIGVSVINIHQKGNRPPSTTVCLVKIRKKSKNHNRSAISHCVK